MYSNMKCYENICNCLRVIQQDKNRKLKSANCWQQTSLKCEQTHTQTDIRRLDSHAIYAHHLIRNFKPLTLFCSFTAWFVPDVVGYPEDSCYCDAAHLRLRSALTPPMRIVLKLISEHIAETVQSDPDAPADR